MSNNYATRTRAAYFGQPRACLTSTPWSVPQAGADGKIDASWIPAGAGDVDSVTSGNANITASPSTGNVVVTLAAALTGITSITSSGTLTLTPGGTSPVSVTNANNAASGAYSSFSILTTYTGGGTKANTDLFINRTETAVGSGAQFLFQAQVGGVDKFTVRNDGGTRFTLVVIPRTTSATELVGNSLAVTTNEGATGLVTRTLPTAVAGLTYTYYVQDADGIAITAGAGDTIRLAGSATAPAGTVTSTTVGSSVTLVAINATEWVATSIVGTWA